MMWHRHTWTIAVKTFAPPAQHGLTLKGGGITMSEHMAERLMMGVTTVLLRCECGKTRVVEMLGPEKP